MDSGVGGTWSSYPWKLYLKEERMNPEIVRVKLPGGGWWDIKVFLSRGDRKKVNFLERQWITTRTDVSAEELVKNPKAGLQFNAEAADIDARDDLLLELGTVAWSFETPFSIEAADKQGDDDVTEVLKMMTKLYLKAEAELAEKLKKG